MKRKIDLKDFKAGINIDMGAPVPHILADESFLHLIFHKEDQEDDDWVILSFENYQIFKFGLPREDSIDNHPYAKYGLDGYGIYKTDWSDWIEEIIKINKKDLPKNPDLKHFIIPFHDSTFECIAKGFDIMEGKKITKKQIKDNIEKNQKLKGMGIFRRENKKEKENENNNRT